MFPLEDIQCCLSVINVFVIQSDNSKNRTARPSNESDYHRNYTHVYIPGHRDVYPYTKYLLFIQGWNIYIYIIHMKYLHGIFIYIYIIHMNLGPRVV